VASLDHENRGKMILRKSVDFQRTKRRYIPEDSTLHNHRCENLKSYAVLNLFIPFLLWPVDWTVFILRAGSILSCSVDWTSLNPSGRQYPLVFSGLDLSLSLGQAVCSRVQWTGLILSLGQMRGTNISKRDVT
jgi:hypothetical protein